MFSDKINQSIKQIPNELVGTIDKSQVFRRINIEYYSLYHNVDAKPLFNSMRLGLSSKLQHSGIDRERATQWREQYGSALTSLSRHLTSNLLQQNKQLPTLGLCKLSDNPALLMKVLSQNPNDYLCHFQLAWLYSQSGNLVLAERHFNIAALQSQTLNPQFSCYSFRHLSDVRYRAGKYLHALLALESAKNCCKVFNAELTFEYVRMLSVAQRTSQALKQLSLLIRKTPVYEVLAQYEPDLLSNPSLKRFLTQLNQQHQQNVKKNLLLQWENDPLRLLDLDKELGHSNSLTALRSKQLHTLEHLPHLLIHDEANASKLIQQQSRRFVMNTLDVRKQNYIQQIEIHQNKAERVHHMGQWLVYAMVVTLMALALSYGISTVASLFYQYWPVNTTIQTLVLISAGLLGVSGILLLHFSPTKLSRLLKQKQQLEQLSLKLGVSS